MAVVHKAAARTVLRRTERPTAGDRAVAGKDMDRPADKVEESQALALVGGTVARLFQMPPEREHRIEDIVLPTGAGNRDMQADTGNLDTDNRGEEDPTDRVRRPALGPPPAVAPPRPRREPVHSPVVPPQVRRAAAVSRRRVQPVLLLEPVRRVPARSAPAAGEAPRQQTEARHRTGSRPRGSYRSMSRRRDTRLLSSVSSM